MSYAPIKSVYYYISFLISQQKQILLELKRTVSMKHFFLFFKTRNIYVKTDGLEKYEQFYSHKNVYLALSCHSYFLMKFHMLSKVCTDSTFTITDFVR